MVDSYEVMWERDISGECPDVDNGRNTITNGSTSYTITGLEEDSNYTVTVAATNALGRAVSVPVIGFTREAGEGLCDTKYIYIIYICNIINVKEIYIIPQIKCLLVM